MYSKIIGNLNKYLANIENEDGTDRISRIITKSLDYIDEKNHYLEFSRQHSTGFKVLKSHFSMGDFISDDSFESMLEYHLSSNDKIDINVYHSPFIFKKLFPGIEDKYNAVYSFYGMSFDHFYTLSEKILTLLKIGGIFVLEFPSYWFIKDEISEMENQILKYSRVNEKKWLFIKPLDEVTKENNCEIVLLEKTGDIHTVNRKGLAYLASLEKLENAENTDNKAHLETCNIPADGIQLSSGLLIIRKKEKVITKDNIFNI